MFCSVAICIPHVVQAVSEVSAEAFESDFQAVNLQTAEMPAQFGDVSFDLRAICSFGFLYTCRIF